MCMIDIGDEFGPCFKARHRTARKIHKCGDCEAEIAPGTPYVYAAGIFQGSFWTAKQCEKCQLAAAWLKKHCHGFLYGGVWEDIQEHAYDVWHDLKPDQQEELAAMLAQTGNSDMLDWIEEMGD